MNNKTSRNNCTTLTTISNKGFFKRIIDEVEQPLRSAIQSTEQLTTSVIVTSAHTVDLSVTTLNAIAEGVGYTAKHSSEVIKRINIDTSVKSLTVDLLKDKKKED